MWTREVNFGLYKCNGFDHPECGWCEWISKMFWTPFGCVLSTQCQTDGWKRMLIPGINRVGSTRLYPFKKWTCSNKSVSELRELSDWRLCVWRERSEIAGRPACMKGSRATVPYMVQRSVCVFLFQFPASITDPTSQSWLDNKPLSHAHMHRLPRKFMIKKPANRVHAEKP